VGALAYALTPLTVALSTRESILSLITGLPYQSFNFLHRWTGRVIFIQSFLHTLGWTIVEGKLYQPQPKVYQEFMAQQYIIFGVVAMLLITLLYIGSMKSVMKWTGHEVFRKTHYVIAALYFGACWGHWAKLACWMIASIGIMFLDRGVRLIRLAMIHYGGWTGVKGELSCMILVC
jgi:ferric-chelate reductase